MTDGLRAERQGHVLVVTIDRQERMNALDWATHDALRETWESVKTDRSVRAIVITGAGERAFCTGMDLQDHAARGPRPTKPDVHDELRQTPLQSDVWLPTIVAVNGVTTGSGLSFVADADVVVASTAASFVDTHVSVGQVAVIEPLGLLPRIGLGNARRLVVLGRGGRIRADEALRISLVDEIVEPAELLPRALELAEIAASGSPSATEASKRALHDALDLPLGDALQRGWEALLAHREHPDSQEGPRAFAEGRDPQWR